MSVSAIAVALFCLPTSVQAGDAGEFSTVMLAGGVPHPSGYPVMRVLGFFARAAHALGLNPASAAALPCALLGAGALVILFRALAPITRCGPAFVACASVGVSPLFVAHVYDAEVWGPLLAFAALYLALAIRRDPPRPLWLGVVLGLGTAHHLTFVLLAPLAVGAAWPQDAESKRDHEAGEAAHVGAASIVKAGIEGLVGSALGLCFFFTLFIGDVDPAAPGWRWGELGTLEGWLHHVSRGDYGTTELSHHDAQVGAIAQWSRTLGSMGSAFGGKLLAGRPLPTLALLCTMAALAWRGPLARLRSPFRWGLAVSMLGATFWFPTLFDLDPGSPFAAWILERFDLLPTLLWTAVFAMALSALLSRWQLRPMIAAAPAIACLAVAGISGLPKRPAIDHELRDYVIAMLASVESSTAPGERSYLLGTDDHRTFPTLFMQEVVGLAPDVVYIDPALMRYAFYRSRITTRYPEVPPIPQPAKLVAALQALPGSPDVYLANIMSRRASQLPLVAQGAVYRVLTARELAAPPDLVVLAARHHAAQTPQLLRGREFASRILDPRRIAEPVSPWASDVWSLALDLDVAMERRLSNAGPPGLAAPADVASP